VSNLGVAPALLNYPDGQENAIWMREDTKKSHAVAAMPESRLALSLR
jgi:hypothetical protein